MCSATIDAAASAARPRRLPVSTTPIGFPVGADESTAPTVRPPSSDAAARHHRRRHGRRRRPSGWPTRSSACCRRRPCAIARPASRRPARPADIAILFRSRDSHREFERRSSGAASRPTSTRGWGSSTPTKSRTRVALLRYLADPLSDLRAAALLRSRLVRLSDAGVARLAPQLAAAIARRRSARARRRLLGDEDRTVLRRLRAATCRAGWRRSIACRRAELLERDPARRPAYAYETARAAPSGRRART